METRIPVPVALNIASPRGLPQYPYSGSRHFVEPSSRPSTIFLPAVGPSGAPHPFSGVRGGGGYRPAHPHGTLGNPGAFGVCGGFGPSDRHPGIPCQAIRFFAPIPFRQSTLAEALANVFIAATRGRHVLRPPSSCLIPIPGQRIASASDAAVRSATSCHHSDGIVPKRLPRIVTGDEEVARWLRSQFCTSCRAGLLRMPVSRARQPGRDASRAMTDEGVREYSRQLMPMANSQHSTPKKGSSPTTNARWSSHDTPPNYLTRMATTRYFSTRAE